jgi:hypothetical protein
MFGLTISGLLLATAVICAIFLIAGTRGGGVEIVLPTPPEVSDGGAPGGAPGGAEAISVTPKNVRSVIATLARPAAYSRDIMVESFWEGGNAVNNFRVYVTQGASLLRTSAGGTDKSILLTREYAYIWYTGDRSARRVPLQGDNAADEYQMLLTYEDIIALDEAVISDAGFTADGGEPGIFVKYSSGALGYRTECRVAIALGLIVSAEQYDGDTLIYRMTAGECSTEEPDPGLFTLPDGTNVLGGF